MSLFREIVGLFLSLRRIFFWLGLSFCFVIILRVCQFVIGQDNAKRFPWTVIILFWVSGRHLTVLKFGASSLRLSHALWQSDLMLSLGEGV